MAGSIRTSLGGRYTLRVYLVRRKKGGNGSRSTAHNAGENLAVSGDGANMPCGNDIAVRAGGVPNELIADGYGRFDGDRLNLFHDPEDAVLGDGSVRSVFRSSMAGLRFPFQLLHAQPHSCPHVTRGHATPFM